MRRAMVSGELTELLEQAGTAVVQAKRLARTHDRDASSLARLSAERQKLKQQLRSAREFGSTKRLPCGHHTTCLVPATAACAICSPTGRLKRAADEWKAVYEKLMDIWANKPADWDERVGVLVGEMRKGILY